MRILSFEYAELKRWLSGRADIVQGKSPWEILRYEHLDGVGMIYQRKNGRLTAAGVAVKHVLDLRAERFHGSDYLPEDKEPS